MDAYADVAARGRVLLQNVDATVVHDPPFVVASLCEGAPLDLAIRRVSLFAFTLSAIIATIVALRAAPLPIIAIAIVWCSGALTARLVAARRHRQHGAFVVDFENERASRTHGTSAEEATFDKPTIELLRSVDGAAPYWLILRPTPAKSWRFAKGTADELHPLVRSLALSLRCSRRVRRTSRRRSLKGQSVSRPMLLGRA